MTIAKRAILGIFLFGLITGFSAQYKADRRVVLPANEVHEGWLFAGGGEVVIEGTVNGDVYAAGGIVEINGTVNGDLLAAGGQIIIAGSVTEDVRAAGATIRVEGNVGGNCTIAGATLTIARSGKVGDNLLAAGGTVRLSGTILRKVLVSAGELAVAGTIGEDIRFFGEEISVYEGADIRRNLDVFVGDTSKVMVASGTVRGTVTTEIVERDAPRVGPIRFWGRAFYALMLIATAGIVVLLVPKHVRSAGTMMLEEPGKTVLWGLVAFIVVPVASVLVMVTIIGLPLGLFGLFLFGWLLFLSQLSLPILFAEFIGGEKGSKGWKLFWPIAAGIVVLQIVMLAPYVRFLTLLAGIVLGLGIMSSIIYKGLKASSKQ